MSDEIKRYDQWCAVTHRHQLSEREDGLWMLYADHARAVCALEKRVAELERSYRHPYCESHSNAEICAVCGFFEHDPVHARAALAKGEKP